jgi:hypothetical protein
LQRSQQALQQKAQEAQSLSEAILAQPTDETSVPPTFVALRATAAAVGTSAAAVTCQGAPSIRFSASQSSIAPGEQVYLQWSNAQHVTNVSIEPGLGKVSLEGSQIVEPKQTTQYILKASGCGGTTTQNVTIQVNAPTVPIQPTALPPTAVPATDVPPTATRVVPTLVLATPTPAASPTENIPPGVYVMNVRVAPPSPRSGDAITFYSTFVNTTGQTQEFNYCVELFKPESVAKSVGISTCTPQRLEPGTTELSSTGWNVREGACTEYLARAISEDQAKARTKLLKPDGNVFYLNFTVCP